MAKANPYPSQSELNHLFSAGEDGNLYWKNPVSKRYAGMRVGVEVTVKGYARVRVDKRPLFLHRVLWKMWYGYDPDTVDHIDGNRLNNSRSNLREATHSENQRNMRPRGGASRFKGVYRARCGKKWGARIKFENKTHHLGTHESEERAAMAYDRAAMEMHGSFAATNKSFGLY